MSKRPQSFGRAVPTSCISPPADTLYQAYFPSTPLSPQLQFHVTRESSPAGVARIAVSHIDSDGRSKRYVASPVAVRTFALNVPSGLEAVGSTLPNRVPRRESNRMPPAGFMFASVSETVAFGFCISAYCPAVTS